MLTAGVLFAGIGGADKGLEDAGFRVKWQVENEPFCQSVLESHWPDVRRVSDVHAFPPMVQGIWHRSDWDVDLLWCSDPCQENSRARSPHENALSPSLGNESIRVISLIRPRLVVRENPSRVRSDAPWPWQRFRQSLERLGYVVLPFRLRACCFGFDHERDRLYLLAEHADAMRQRLEGRRQSRDASTALPEKPRNEAGKSIPEMVGALHGLRAGSVNLRDGYGFSGGMDRHRIKACGNCQVPVVAEFIGRQILKAIE